MSEFSTLQAIAEACGITPSDAQIEQLLRFRAFLETDGVVAGAIGPHESGRLIDRHVGDALVYLRGLGASTHRVLDVGSGLGLPGIPLAIARPDLAVVLLDRSGRRTLLAKRAVRILNLPNVEVRQGEVHRVSEQWDAVTFRASLPIPDAATLVPRLLTPDGVAVVGVSRHTERPTIPEPPRGVRFEVTSELVGVLDTPAWLLRMTLT